MPEQQNYLVKVFVRDFSTGQKLPVAECKTPVENAVMTVELPKDMPDASRLEIEFCGKVQD